MITLTRYLQGCGESNETRVNDENLGWQMTVNYEEDLSCCLLLLQQNNLPGEASRPHRRACKAKIGGYLARKMLRQSEHWSER
jgi:hypothetical protein